MRTALYKPTEQPGGPTLAHLLPFRITRFCYTFEGQEQPLHDRVDFTTVEDDIHLDRPWLGIAIFFERPEDFVDDELHRFDEDRRENDTTTC